MRVAFGYLVLLHLFCLFLVLKTDFLPKVAAKINLEEMVSKARIAFTMRYFRWFEGAVPDHANIFLGDSITYGLDSKEVTLCDVNYGVEGINTQDLLDVMPALKSLARSNAIFLMIGINDLGQGTSSGLDARLRSIFYALPSEPVLIWSAIMPTGTKETGIDLAATIEANRVIKSLCGERTNCRYVDTWLLFADQAGQIQRDLFRVDGLHLSADGYRVWQSALKTALNQAQPAVGQSTTPLRDGHTSRCKIS